MVNDTPPDDTPPQDTPGAEPVSFRIRRYGSGRFGSGWFGFDWGSGRLARARRALTAKGWTRRLAIVAVLLALVYAALWATVLRGLPSADKLLTYQPTLPTMVRGDDGEIASTFARERRVELRYVDFPEPLIGAFLSAEDKSFFQHHGVDVTGLGAAVIDYATKFGTGNRARGGSTITQQVAKNLLIGNEYKVSRKLKEMVLAMRIESVLTKQQILELYLNEIALGRNSFGVQAASRAYFDKDVGDLKLHEAAFLAILPKAPEEYGRAKFIDKAMTRRNWVLDQMVKNGYATRTQADDAKAQSLGLVTRRPDNYTTDAGYFLEEVRRQLIDQFGENPEDSVNSVYGGGLWVRTSLDTRLQSAAQTALRAGLLRYAAGHAWHGPIATVDPAQWQGQLIGSNISIKYLDWRIGAILEKAGSTGRIGFTDGTSGVVSGLADAIRPGDVVAVAPNGTDWALRIIPEVSGGMVVQDPEDGRVLAMQGGFDARLGSFNRATQANRQPGSAIKPFVYATALDNGMTPASIVLDGTFCVYQGAALGQKCFKNFGDEGGGGSHTMRWGLEQSRNLMTVRIANDIGMEKVVRMIKTLGIGNYPAYLSMALGAGDTTVAHLVNAYGALADHGRLHDQTLIDFVQDRNGKVIFRADKRNCDTCNMAQWDGHVMPRFKPTGHQAMDPRTAFQVEHMLEGVVVRGTAASLRDLNLPIFGKTGTTTGPTNVWFVGGSPTIIAGIYMGYDQPRSLGGYAQGGRIAAPIFKQFVTATRDEWHAIPFTAPEGVRLVKIDRVSGKRVFEGTPDDRDPKAGIIWEAFKPDSEPRRTNRDLQISTREAVLDALRKAYAAKYGATVAGPGEAAPVEDDGTVY